jgi:pyruvate/2-oxoglutarate dehydrogenase complex dihydrolipoamide dehydrogenase (E3) component
MERMRYLRSQVGERYKAADIAKSGIDVFLGEGRFNSHRSVEVDGKVLNFRKALIASGSSPVVPAVEGMKEASPLTSDTVFSLTRVPRRLAIIVCDTGPPFGNTFLRGRGCFRVRPRRA